MIFLYNVDHRVFLDTWKEIPSTNEFCSTVSDIFLTSDQLEAKLNANNIFTMARRIVINTDGANKDLTYMSAKLINGAWLLAEFDQVHGSTSVKVKNFFKCYSSHIHV